MKKLIGVAGVLALGHVGGRWIYQGFYPTEGELAAALSLSIWGMAIGFIVFQILLGTKGFFTGENNKGLIVVMGALTLALLSPLVTTRLYSGQLASNEWFSIIFVLGMISGAILRCGL